MKTSAADLDEAFEAPHRAAITVGAAPRRRAMTTMGVGVGCSRAFEVAGPHDPHGKMAVVAADAHVADRVPRLQSP